MISKNNGGDEIHELVNFLPLVEQQNEAISLAKENGFIVQAFSGVASFDAVCSVLIIC